MSETKPFIQYPFARQALFYWLFSKKPPWKGREKYSEKSSFWPARETDPTSYNSLTLKTVYYQPLRRKSVSNVREK